MNVSFQCPQCGRSNRCEDFAAADVLSCRECDWSRAVEPSGTAEGKPQRCGVCGCGDLWRQKDFPQKLGLACVAAGAVVSTVFWAQHRPVLALGTLLLFALADLLLFTFMRDVLVCYRCGARYRGFDMQDESHFDLETAERYRQERLRLEEASKSPS